MGLTIHYTLHAGARSTAAVRTLIAALRRHATSLPFTRVGKIVHLSGPQCQITGDDDPLAWLKSRADYSPRHTPRIIAFTAYPAAGSESASFGLAASPPAAPRSRLPAWSWHSFCKTQYASNSSLGGMKNFLAAHLAIIHLLDHAQTLGILQHVSDEGGFWQHRSTAALVREAHEWNHFIAAGYGALRDSLESAGHNPQTLHPRIIAPLYAKIKFPIIHSF